MCQFLSVILTKEREILYHDGYSHESIITKHKLKDTSYPNNDWIRIEIVNGEVKVDEVNIPKWYKNSHDKQLLTFSKNMPYDLQLMAVRQNGYSIQYIKNPSSKVQLMAVKQNSYSIEYIKNPSNKIQLMAVKQDGWSIRFIDNPSKEVQLEAVKKYGYSIEYIKNPSNKIQLEAVKQNSYSIEYIKNPSKEVLEYIKR